MANYGLQSTPSRIPFTGYSPTLGNGDAVTPGTSGYVYSNGITQGDAQLARLFRNGAANSAAVRVMYTLLGAAVGGTATKTVARVQAVVGGAGGAMPIETINLVNRVTTAADLTAVQALFNRTTFPATYVADASGNGGGGKGAY